MDMYIYIHVNGRSSEKEKLECMSTYEFAFIQSEYT